MSEFETIIYQKEDRIARIILNRPRQLNAYNLQMRDDLYQVLLAIRDDDEVRVTIISGAGDKAFCAGADLTDFLAAPSPEASRRVRWERDVWGLFLGLPQPVIAAVHGYVLGDGLEISLCCDLIVTADNANFGLPETGLGIIPAAGGSQTLPRAVGRALALDMLLSGRWLNADEAYQAGLVNRVVVVDELMPTAWELAQKIAGLKPAVVRAIKRAVNRSLDLPLARGLELEQNLAARVRLS